MPTSVEELERVHLRFIKVGDGAKLTEILSKILPNIMSIFMEEDLANVASMDHPKMKALEQIISHLMMREKNSPDVNPPWVALLQIFNDTQYNLPEANPWIKHHVSTRIFEFIFESFDRIPPSLDLEILGSILRSQNLETMNYSDKCQLYLIALQRMLQYFKSQQVDDLQNILSTIFEGYEEVKAAFLQMSLYYLIQQFSPHCIQEDLRNSWANAQQQMILKFKAKVKETDGQFIENYITTIIKVIGMQKVFSAKDTLPMYIIAMFQTFNKVRDLAELSIRNIFQSIDTKDTSLAQQIYRLCFSETYIYRDFQARQDQDLQQFPVPVQTKLIEYLIKFECSATLLPYNQKLVFHCFNSNQAQMLADSGLTFVKHMIRYNDIAGDQRSVVFLRETLTKILQQEQIFTQIQRSRALALLGDMAMRNYSAVNDDIDIAISTFEKLKERIEILTEEHSFNIGADEIAMNYIETLNRFRDCYEGHLHDEEKRKFIVDYVLTSLNKEEQTNSDITYLLFLYLVRLDDGTYQSSVLLNSILLKDHPDIKIKREASRQIDAFNQNLPTVKFVPTDKQVAVVSQKRILKPFLKDVEMFLSKNTFTGVFSGPEEHQRNMLTFNSTSFKQEFIEKLMEITQFTVRFFKEELKQENDSMQMDTGEPSQLQLRVERMLLMNLNPNFSLHKSDFSAALKMIVDFLEVASPQGVLKSIGLNLLFKLSQGNVNLLQRVLTLKLMIRILRVCENYEPDAQELYSKLASSLPQQTVTFDSLNHEARMNLFTQLTLLTLFSQNIAPQVQTLSIYHFQQALYNLFPQQAQQPTMAQQANLTPNTIEQIKYLGACLKKIGRKIDLSASQICEKTNVEQIIDYQIGIFKRSEIDIVFRKYILGNIPGIMKKVDKTLQLNKAEVLLQAMLDVDNPDLQEPLGTALAKIHQYANFLKDHVIKCLERVFAREGQTLNTKRNSAIYLYQIIHLYGEKEKEIQDMFIDIQRVFLKFLFDRKTFMQDLSSKALSKIYNLGSPDVRNQLVDNLSQTLSGEKSTQEHQEKDENNELLLEFKDNTSTEQREKLKTYKDLCNIAVELGHRELIYQFLEVHRHMSHYQDVKNAAKGLSSIIVMDEKLRGNLLKIAPKILLLSYDHNNEIKETMKELWTSLIDVEKEEQVINERWNEIFKEAFDGLNSKEYRRRQSSALALSDFMANRSWPQIKDKFREVFLTSLGLMDDQKDSVKLAAYQLGKTMKRVTLKLGNIYTNGNIEELEQVLGIVIPMILDDCMKSSMKAVKFFGVDLLFDIIKTSQNNNMLKQLKVNNKYERQLVFNYNSEQKMKEIMNKFLDRIIVEVLANVSQMNKAVETINYFEQFAIEQGISGSSSKGKQGISEGELNDLRLKYTKESAWGEILKICRDQLTQDTFNKILNDILGFMFKGHDQITKSSAVAFIDDMILENKLQLITPQNSRKIATKLVEIYTLNSVSAALSMKESIQQLYATCLGLQMKILRDYPKTVGQLVETLVKLPKELDIIVIMNIYEISKNLPDDMLRSQQQILLETFPVIYVNRFQMNDHRLKTLARKAFSYLTENVPDLTEHSQPQIFALILQWLDSSSYDDRVAASQALQELCTKLFQEDDLNKLPAAREVLEKMHALIQGKYFNNKEQVVEGFMSLVKVMDLSFNTEFANLFVGETCYKQIEKNLNGGKLAYKNTVMRAMIPVLQGGKLTNEVKQKMFEMLARDLRFCLEKVSEKAAMIESLDDFEEKREEEKETLQSALIEFDCIPYLLPDPKSLDQNNEQTLLCELASHYYNRTNWLIRNGALTCYHTIYSRELVTEQTLIFTRNLIKNVAELGEKYDSNLALASDIMVMYCDKKHLQSEEEKQNLQKILIILKERGTEKLLSNYDLIKKYLE